MKEKVHNILDHAGWLYHRYGVKSVTMDDVARHLCISKKTLYEFFMDKKDLVSQVLKSEFNTSCLVFDEIEGRKCNAIEQLFEVYKLISRIIRDYNPSMDYDLRKYYPDLYHHIRSIRRKRIYQAGFNNLKKGIGEGLYRKELNADIVARLHLFRIENLFDSDLFTSEDLRSFEVFHELFVYHLHGIMSSKGRIFFEKNFIMFRQSINLSAAPEPSEHIT